MFQFTRCIQRHQCPKMRQRRLGYKQDAKGYSMQSDWQPKSCTASQTLRTESIH